LIFDRVYLQRQPGRPGFHRQHLVRHERDRYARNTYSWDQFDTIELTVRLAAGNNTITFGNLTAYAPNIDKITVAPAYLP
jgi:hypothetical protein